MKKLLATSFILTLLSVAFLFQALGKTSKAGSSSVKEMERQKKEAETEIAATQKELSNTEQKVTESLAALRKIDSDIENTEKEMATVQGQINLINGNIAALEEGIAGEEADLDALRAEYLKTVKKMRVARKRNSTLAFIFASSGFNEARRRMRYMKEFSDWRERRSDEILGRVTVLAAKKGELQQNRNDAAVALKRAETTQDKLNRQKTEQQVAVKELRAHSQTLKDRIARRKAEAKKLSGQISNLIAEQQAKEAAEKKRAEEQRIAREKAEAEKRAAEERRLAEEKKKAEEKLLAEKKAGEEKAGKSNKDTEIKDKKKKEEAVKETTKKETASKENKKKEDPKKEEYAAARRRQPRSGSASQESTSTAVTPPATSGKGFEGMKGQLPKPVNGSFKIVSAFGVHPLSAELPDIMDENLGIDAHVANGSNACAVYEGEVIKIYDRTNTPGFRNIIVVKHGDYITVYANLETLAVKPGQKVRQGDVLGTVGSDFDEPSHGLIHFELWKNQNHLDPAAWIRI